MEIRHEFCRDGRHRLVVDGNPWPAVEAGEVAKACRSIYFPTDTTVILGTPDGQVYIAQPAAYCGMSWLGEFPY